MRKIILLLMLIVSLSGQATVYHVAATGGDFSTIAQVNATTLSAGDQVLFSRGETFIGTIILNYSGSAGNPVTYGAYGTGANPIITGFTTITGWTNEGNGIYYKVISAESQVNMVTIDGVQYAMGRYPNSTFLTWESASTNVSITDNAQTGTPNWTGSEIVLKKNEYTIDRCLVTSQSGSTLNYTSLGTTRNADATGSYFIQNSYSVLDSYGEWYHDTSTGKFYMYFGAVVPTTKTVKVSTLDNLCKVNALKQYNKIENIDFTGSSKDIISAETSCHYLTVQNCNFSFAGLDGIWVDAQNVTISGNTFNYCNRISIHSVGANLTATNNSISNNAVLIGQGNKWIAGVSAIHIFSDNPTVTGNTIQNTGTNGIAMSSAVDNGMIKNNYIYNTCLLNPDHGSIYTDGSHVDLNIWGNVIVESLGSGVYLDEYSTNISVRKNSISGCNIKGIKLHKASNDSIVDNTLFDNTIGIGLENWLNENNFTGDVITGNKVVALTNQNTLSFATRYAGYASVWSELTIDNNIYARPTDDDNTIITNFPSIYQEFKTLAEWRTISGKDANSTGSPFAVSSTSDIRFEYNETNSPVVVALGQNYRDIQTNNDHTSYELAPYSSVVLLKHDPYPSTGTRKQIKYGGKTLIYNGKILKN